jgi:hypothetical protein
MSALRRAPWVVPLLLATLPGALLAQDKRLEARLDAAALQGVSHELDAARAAGLPAEPLIQKALEGAAMHAEASRIVDAVRGLRERLAGAREALGPAATESELVAGAGALQVDVPPEALRRIRGETRGGAADLPLVVLADLVQQGVPPASASQAVESLARAGARPDGYNLLRYRVELDIRQGTAPTTAAERQSRLILRSLRGGGGPPGGA